MLALVPHALEEESDLLVARHLRSWAILPGTSEVADRLAAHHAQIVAS
jgi:hypothetical protein